MFWAWLIATVMFVVGLIACGNLGRKYLSGYEPTDKPVSLPTWAKLLVLATPVYFCAMYWTEAIYHPGIQRREYLRRPFQPLLDSKFSAVAQSYKFSQVADLPDDKQRSDVLLFEDGKPLGPAHSQVYHVAVLGMGRYAHFKAKSVAIAFSSSDNTDPMTNGRIYWAERP